MIYIERKRAMINKKSAVDDVLFVDLKSFLQMKKMVNVLSAECGNCMLTQKNGYSELNRRAKQINKSNKYLVD